ncbi:MAG: gamma-glutamyltransferase [Alphaproteobacteria bacterium]|nr:gamma-glutamyltransferase [Alphaproteobacteria bacterium]
MTAERTTETWTVTKPAVASSGGLVASQHHLASAVGARVLAEGGNAVDAAVATSLAIGAIEPWMSGLGGGGFMLVAPPGEPAQTVAFGMVAPAALDPGDYPVVGGKGSDLFAWPKVLEDRNLLGYPAMAVPGYVAGLALALERFGTRRWRALIAPAIALAEAGLVADWYATLLITTAARDLARFAESARTYLADGFPVVGEFGAPPPRIRLGRLAATLRQLGEAGPRDFYAGEIAAAIVSDCRVGGGTISRADLERYEARIEPAAALDYRGARVFAAPGLTAGLTLHAALQHLAANPTPGARPAGAVPDGAAYLSYAAALFAAYRERLATMGEASPAPSCTTHISVVDRRGMFVALTQTLLSLFGSKVMLPATGILMNNGIMWFDPEPGKPNSIAPGRRPLSNMCPAIVERGDGLRFALGASGGRRILPAVFQLISFLVDYRMSIDRAFAAPRLDVSGGDVVGLDDRLPDAVRQAVAARYPTRVDRHGVYPALFACPNLVARDGASGQAHGAAFVMSPWAQVAAAP